MIIVDEYKNVFQTMLHPGDATKKTMTLVEALMYYWKAILIPLVILVIEYSFLSASVSALGSLSAIPGLSSLGSYIGIALVIATVLIYLVAIPIFLLIDAFILYLIGAKIGSFKGAWSDTFTGLVYGETASISLAWVPIVSIISLVWGIIVALLAVANQNQTDWVKVLISAILSAIIIFVIVFVLGAVFGLALGL